MTEGPGSFLVWRCGTPVEGVSVVQGLLGVDDEHGLYLAEPYGVAWPADAEAAMNPDTPRDVALADGLYGVAHIVVSARVAERLSALSAPVELLPVTLRNHKGRVTPVRYVLVNALRVVDCIDLTASGARWNTIDPTRLCGCVSLVLRPDAIPRDAQIFRLEHWRNVTMVRRDIADGLSAGTRGLHFQDPREYTGNI